MLYFVSINKELISIPKIVVIYNNTYKIRLIDDINLIFLIGFLTKKTSFKSI